MRGLSEALSQTVALRPGLARAGGISRPGPGPEGAPGVLRAIRPVRPWLHCSIVTYTEHLESVRFDAAWPPVSLQGDLVTWNRFSSQNSRNAEQANCS